MAKHLEEYKRKQRKKEKQKNKVKRISARDAKVAETASLHSVQSEIKKLETKKENHNGHLDNKDTRKLERLRKELKIVIGAEEKRKKQAEEKAKQEWEDRKKRMKTKEGVEEMNIAKFKHAKASIYYDPVMNPYGAPPPGRPILYHKRGGGKTMNPDEAFIPYELRDENDDKSVDLQIEEKIPMDDIRGVDGDGNDRAEKGEIFERISAQNLHSLPPLPHPREFHNVQQKHKDEHKFRESYAPPPPPPPPPLPVQPPPPPPPPPRPQERDTSKLTNSGLPALPKPSNAVKRIQRSKKSKNSSIMADIWASNEELQYEGNLEGAPEIDRVQQHHAFKKKRKLEKDDMYDPLCPADEGYSEYRSKDQIKRSTINQKKQKSGDGGACSEKPCAWHYLDKSGTLQGPFSSDQMVGWGQAGFFPNDTMVRNGESGEFVEIGSVDLSTGRLKQEVSMEPPVEVPDDGYVDARISMLRNSLKERSAQSIDDRILALKQSMAQESSESVDDRIAALKRTMQEGSVDDRILALKQNMNEEPSESVDDRIAALKNTMQKDDAAQSVDDRILALKHSMNEENPESVDDRIAALKDTMEEDNTAQSVDDRILALKQSMNQELAESVDDRLAALKEDTAENVGERHNDSQGEIVSETEVPVYPIHQEPEAQNYPSVNEMEVSAYYVDGDTDVPAYPVNEDEVPVYPVVDMNEVPAYPAVDDIKEVPAYPVVDDINEVTAYPAVDDDIEAPAYPVDDDASDIPYPVDVAYPAYGDNAYPNTDDAYGADQGEEVVPYCIPDGDTSNTNTDRNGERKKATYKGDKEVIGFVPSNLQVRRKAQPSRRKQVKTSATIAQKGTKVIDKESTPSSKNVADDYEMFMSKINALK